MIRIETKEFDLEEVKQSLLYEFTKMILCGMELPRKSETIEQAMELFANELEIIDTDAGFMVGNEDPDFDFDVQDCAFSVAWNLFQKNNYSDAFGSDQACLSYLGKQMLEKYPGIEFFAKVFLDTEWSNTLEIVKTVDGRIETEIEEL